MADSRRFQFQQFADEPVSFVISEVRFSQSGSKESSKLNMGNGHMLGVQPYGSLLMSGGGDCRTGKLACNLVQLLSNRSCTAPRDVHLRKDLIWWHPVPYLQAWGI